MAMPAIPLVKGINWHALISVYVTLNKTMDAMSDKSEKTKRKDYS
jgi:hypothetical protein